HCATPSAAASRARRCAACARAPPPLRCCACPPCDLHSFPTRRSSDLLQKHLSTLTKQKKRSLRGSCTFHLSSSPAGAAPQSASRSEEHTSELQSREKLVCRLLLEKKNGMYAAKRTAKTASPAATETDP